MDRPASEASTEAAAFQRAAAEVAVGTTSAHDAATGLVAMLTTAERLGCLDGEGPRSGSSRLGS